MKVRYVANTLSSSVANAMKFLKNVGIEGFENCDATVKFIQTIDYLFDFLNTKNPFGKGFKQPLTRDRLLHMKEVLPDKLNYLFNLRTADGKKLIIDTGRKTFICGLVLAVKSVLDIAEDIFNERPNYKYLLTYKFSQDHLEILFGKIRSRHGNNNNPNVLQFKYAIRQILMRNDIKTQSNSFNCIEFDNDPMGAVFDIIWKKKRQDNILEETINVENSDDDMYINNILPKNLQMLNENIIYYIGSYIIKKLNIIDCYNCIQRLTCKREHSYARCEPFAEFVEFSTRKDGLIRPSNSVFKILMETERQIQIQTAGLTNLQTKHVDLKIVNKVKRRLVLENTIFPDLKCDDAEILETPHKVRLITAIYIYIYIAVRYIKIRLQSYSKFYTQNILQTENVTVSRNKYFF